MRKRYVLIVLMFFLTFILNAQQVKIKYYMYLYTTVNYYPSSLDKEQDSALVEQLFSQIGPSDIVGDYCTEQTIIFPQISGMKNKKLQDSLNAGFKFHLEYNTGDGVINTLYTAIGTSTDFIVDSSKIKTIRKFKSKQFPEEYSTFYNATIVTVTNDRFLNICSREEENGNMAAHPNFSEDNVILDLTDGSVVTLATLFKGNYLNEIKKIMKDNLQYKDDSSMCTPKKDWINRINSETVVAKITSNTITLKADKRDFGCPEVARDIMTIDIPLIKLDKYKKPYF
jgi:hypothetical protein